MFVRRRFVKLVVINNNIHKGEKTSKIHLIDHSGTHKHQTYTRNRIVAIDEVAFFFPSR